ncbi:MAG: DUF4132 domain-containing protein [Myxococcota bacterium]|nr:DUF4132 domain-containing protein [Myxococcota bacterium]
MKPQQLHLRLPAQPAEATEDSLPPILRMPPWRMPRPAPLPPTELLLRAPSGTCTPLWAPGERMRHLRPARPHSARHLRRLKALLRAKAGALWMLDYLEDVIALDLWSSAPETDWERLPVEDLLALVARFEGAALPGLLACAARDLSAATTALSRLHSACIAPLMASALNNRSSRGTALSWLLHDPALSALGLIPAAVSPGNRAALSALRLLEQHDQSRVIQNAAASYGPTVSAWIGRWLARSPLLDVPSRRPKMPIFWAPKDCHRPTLSCGAPLPLSAIQHLGEMLCFTPVAPAYAGLQEIRRSCCPEHMDVFVLSVFHAWEAAGCPPQHDWPLWALGHLGGDLSVRHLSARIRSWPGHGGASRAANALQVLAMIGTPLAHLHLHHIAETTRYAALRQGAWSILSRLAHQQRVNLSDLIDRDPPRLGLDAQGRRILDFGTRRFQVAFSAELQPRVQDQRGRSLRALPRPGRRDVLWQAEAAWQTWRALRQDVKTLTTTWSRRMERLMCRARSLPADTFRAQLRHPILSHSVAGVIWSAVTTTSERLFCFRVAEDFTLIGRQGEPVLLPHGARIGIPHRLHLSDEAADGWSAVLAHEAITQPFRQLHRPTFTPTPEESSAPQLTRLVQRVVPAGRVMALLSRGWQWGDATEAGFISCIRPIHGAPSVAVLPLRPGIAHTAPGPQRLGPIVLKRTDHHGDAPGIPGRLSPLQFSELLCDLTGLLDA